MDHSSFGINRMAIKKKNGHLKRRNELLIDNVQYTKEEKNE